MRGLLIEVEWVTGKRGNEQITIDELRQGKLISLGGCLWQRLEHEPGGNFEIRLVKDDRDITTYTGEMILDDGSIVKSIADVPLDRRIVDVKGAIPLETKDEINKAINLSLLPKYYGELELIRKWCETNVPEVLIYISDPYKFMEEAFRAGCPDIRKVEPPLL